MKNKTINISFQSDLLSEVDLLAKNEMRSRSELLREAARQYLERKQKWQFLFKQGRKSAKSNNITDRVILSEIKKARKSCSR